MPVLNPYSMHYQSWWRDHASNPDLKPQWLRVAAFAYATHGRNGHAPVARGELMQLLGTQYPSTVQNAIAKAVDFSFLHEDSCAECLIVPSHGIAKNIGADADCVHTPEWYRRKRQRKSAPKKEWWGREMNTSAVEPTPQPEESVA
ncbi:hypothetical protein [Mycolicibacterium hippocampi]|uniref:hypothetical protein n=1 Tax=Mycolicibacterium hippocampi TaxID=659824 RepID=UPI0035118DBB